ncbi:MAG: GtrA family protein [Gammaproteobacteria bacterium]|nr:GtrA family protein [Gammaproteobacteria bacterium]
MKKNNWAFHFWSEATYIARYLGSGVVNTVLGFVVIFSAMALGFSPVVSNVTGYAVGFTSGFVLSKKFVFRSSGHFVAESVRYVIAFVISFLFNLLVLYLSLTYFHFHPVISQIAAAVSYTLLMYILARSFVFNTVNDKNRY